ncbi:MAG: FAD:protein FMN transferase [Hamadaea sp.]|uniref:FAD:protein FMN transferase n=1 Tax=Hamadaea sp. TaxID=2024425 RepID=UPI0017C4A685|nr:FAD:protein FMN transferase [Hamadaea sp.]NUR73374.1 FAD:protein FMN transferase [Hamadaea sp.]NUT18521.1 FAD:protein FMN transferase [Hamadaea sp.]
MTTARQNQRAWVEQIMGLPISVNLRGPGLTTPAVETRVAAYFAELRRIDEIFSTYRPDSEISRWQRGELTLAAADPLLGHVLALCDRAFVRTSGFFDARSLPDPLGGATRTDPSGLVKGWAVERATRQLPVGLGWCVNAGGDVLVTAADGQPAWRVGIEDPSRDGKILRAVTLRRGAVATSGTRHRGTHIVDPRTRRPPTGLRQVSVLGPELLWADVYATAAFARGGSALEWLAELDGYEGLVVSADGRISSTPGWPIA